MNFRRKELLVSDEVNFYLRLEALTVCKGLTEENTLTRDEVADGILRNELTNRHPEWVVIWEELDTAKRKARKEYKEIEERAFIKT